MKRALSLIIVFVFQLGCTFTDPEVMELLQALQAQNDKLLEEITSMKGQLSALDGRYQTILAGLADNKKDLEVLKGQVEALRTQLADQLKKIDQLTAQLTTQGADVVKISKEIAEVKASCAELIKLLEAVLYEQQIKNLKVGDAFQGGIVAYFFKPSDYGYERGLKGILVATRDLPTRLIWRTAYDNNSIFSSLSTEIGYGDLNTTKILELSKSFNFSAPAAEAASKYEVGNSKGWFLPTELELLIIKQNLANKGIGNFFTEPIGGNVFSTGYWSSSVMGNLVGATAPFFAPNAGVCGCAFFESYLVRPAKYF